MLEDFLRQLIILGCLPMVNTREIESTLEPVIMWLGLNWLNFISWCGMHFTVELFSIPPCHSLIFRCFLLGWPGIPREESCNLSEGEGTNEGEGWNRIISERAGIWWGCVGPQDHPPTFPVLGFSKDSQDSVLVTAMIYFSERTQSAISKVKGHMGGVWEYQA